MTAPVRPQPMIAVASVEASSRFYQRLLGGASGHGGSEYERILVDGALVLQLHAADVAHHHGPFGEPGGPAGNGVALWFEVVDFDGVVRRVGELEAEIVTDVHVNPNARQREIWIRDPDGYLVVFSEARG
jgi:catechol 2,3-dioxygenase-like lactoylglutathione lyase family enzyme